MVGDVAWYNENSGGKTYPVGEKKANELGIHDMSGNVWEWCWDWYADYSSGSAINLQGPSNGSCRVNRGGSCASVTGDCRSADRDFNLPDIRSFNLGFRLAKSL